MPYYLSSIKKTINNHGLIIEQSVYTNYTNPFPLTPGPESWIVPIHRPRIYQVFSTLVYNWIILGTIPLLDVHKVYYLSSCANSNVGIDSRFHPIVFMPSLIQYYWAWQLNVSYNIPYPNSNVISKLCCS